MAPVRAHTPFLPPHLFFPRPLGLLILGLAPQSISHPIPTNRPLTDPEMLTPRPTTRQRWSPTCKQHLPNALLMLEQQSLTPSPKKLLKEKKLGDLDSN